MIHWPDLNLSTSYLTYRVLFKKTGYEVKSIMMDRAVVNAMVLKDGTANWDIMKDTSTTALL